jgi:hypothetical protein
MSLLYHASEERAALEEFNPAYGLAMASWARLEGALVYWLMATTGMEERLARAIFFSASGFGARHDMLTASIPFSPLDGDVRLFLKTACSKSRKYSGFRNRLAHNEPVFNLRENSPSFKQYILVEGGNIGPEAEERAITVAHLASATNNFRLLRRMMLDVHPTWRHPETSATELREQVHRLPIEASSTEPNPNPLRE